MAERELGRAREALARVTADTPSPAWLRFFDDAELAACSAQAHQILGRHGQAVHEASMATALAPPGHQRNKARYTLLLSEALLADGQVEHAAAHAATALDLARNLRDGLHHGRTAHRLRQIRGLLGRRPDVPKAREWIAAYDHATTGYRPDTPTPTST